MISPPGWSEWSLLTQDGCVDVVLSSMCRTLSHKFTVFSPSCNVLLSIVRSHLGFHDSGTHKHETIWVFYNIKQLYFLYALPQTALFSPLIFTLLSSCDKSFPTRFKRKRLIPVSVTLNDCILCFTATWCSGERSEGTRQQHQTDTPRASGSHGASNGTVP